jgi:hypothetical protein
MNEKQLRDIYLDYVNNFLSIEGYASYYNLSIELATHLINHARDIYNLTYKAA